MINVEINDKIITKTGTNFWCTNNKTASMFNINFSSIQFNTLSIFCYSLHILIAFSFCFLPLNNTYSQYFTSEKYPNNNFTNPLNIPLQISGNFGEIRKEHFHMGIDLRTNQKENLPIYAAASGYISRIKIERYGYGRAIYITHPNGYTTLYAHLNNFFDTLHNYVKNKQYAEQQWEQDFTLDAGLFTVNQGQLIAFSGNTGGSQGPHLHFEIRDEKGNNVNPLLFNFSIDDKMKPAFEKLYWYKSGNSIYSSNPIEIPLVKKMAGTFVKDSIVYVNANKISFGITAKDRTNTSAFKFGIYAAEVWADSVMQFGFRLNNISYNNTRYINACIDYSAKYNINQTIYLLKQLPGNYLNIFGKTAANGEIFLNDTLPKPIEIVVKDIVGNYTSLNFLLQYKPDTTLVSNNTPNAANKLLPNQYNVANINKKTLYLNEAALYDTIYLDLYNENNNACYPIHNQYSIAVPINSYSYSNINKLVLVAYNKWFRFAQRPIIKNDSAWGSIHFLGNTFLVEDTIAPTIKTIGFKNNATLNKPKEIIVEIKDNVSEIETYKGTLNGRWIMLSRKNDLFIYEVDERCTLGKNTLNIFATDIVGNETNITYNFTVEDKPINKKKKKLLSKKPIRKKKKKR